MKNMKDHKFNTTSITPADYISPVSRAITSEAVLPIHADREHIKTLYENGLLRIRLSKRWAS